MLGAECPGMNTKRVCSALTNMPSTGCSWNNCSRSLIRGSTISINFFFLLKLLGTLQYGFFRNSNSLRNNIPKSNYCFRYRSVVSCSWCFSFLMNHRPWCFSRGQFIIYGHRFETPDTGVLVVLFDNSVNALITNSITYLWIIGA